MTGQGLAKVHSALQLEGVTFMNWPITKLSLISLINDMTICSLKLHIMDIRITFVVIYSPQLRSSKFGASSIPLHIVYIFLIVRT